MAGSTRQKLGPWSSNRVCGDHGTYLNGHRITRREPLNDRDEIGLGSTLLVYPDLLKIETESL